MSIGNRIDEAIVKLISHDYENALVQISIAIDATAKKKFNNEKKVGLRIRKFINQHESIITHFSMLGSFKIECKGNVIYGDKGSIGNIAYKSIRCALLHEGDVSKNITFKEGVTMGMENNKYIVTDNMLWGLVLILVGEEVNKNQSLINKHQVTCFGKTIDIGSQWGNLEEVKRLTNYV